MFNLDDFNNAIRHFRQAIQVRPDAVELMNEGLRIILEPHERRLAAPLERDIQGILGIDVRLEPMFPGANELPPGRFFDPGLFLLLTVPDCAYEAVGPQAYDLAYYLRENLELRSAEPDVPFHRYEPPTTNQAFSCLEPKGKEPPDYAWSLRNMRIPAAWSMTPPVGGKTKGSGIRIGHPDTGYSDHIDLDQRRLDKTSGYDFIEKKSDPQDPLNYTGVLLSPGHGTATGSVIVSEGDVSSAPIGSANGGTAPPGRITGVAPEAILVPFRAIRSVVRILSGNVARAIYRAMQKDCHVISMSLGGAPSRALHAAIENAIEKNLIVLAAAGNCVRFVVWPASYKNCIALAATNISDRPWKGSSHGRAVAVSAPGEYVWCARRESAADPSHAVINAGQGTSFATANAAGVAALWLAFHKRQFLINVCAQNGSTLQDTFRSLVRSTARIPAHYWDFDEYGAGIIEAKELLSAQVIPSLAPLVDEDYAYIGHLASFLDLPVSEGLLQLLRTLFSSADSSMKDPRHEMELWGHELLNILINNDSLRNEMKTLLLGESNLRQMDSRAYVSIIERIQVHASATLSAMLAHK